MSSPIAEETPNLSGQEGHEVLTLRGVHLGFLLATASRGRQVIVGDLRLVLQPVTWTTLPD